MPVVELSEYADNAISVLSESVRKLQERIRNADSLILRICTERPMSGQVMVDLAWDVHKALHNCCEECGHWEQDGHAATCSKGETSG